MASVIRTVGFEENVNSGCRIMKVRFKSTAMRKASSAHRMPNEETIIELRYFYVNIIHG